MQRDISYYLSKGFDRKSAEYYASGRKRIVTVTPHSDFSLILEFDNGEKRRLDCQPFLEDNTVFSFLRDYGNFRRVYLDEDRCVSWDIDPDIDSREVWSNKIDLCPDSCYIDSVPVNCAQQL
nr:DUF2442 domain-containing protein [Clostridia bacterium]